MISTLAFGLVLAIAGLLFAALIAVIRRARKVSAGRD